MYCTVTLCSKKSVFADVSSSTLYTHWTQMLLSHSWPHQQTTMQVESLRCVMARREDISADLALCTGRGLSPPSSLNADVSAHPKRLSLETWFPRAHGGPPESLLPRRSFPTSGPTHRVSKGMDFQFRDKFKDLSGVEIFILCESQKAIRTLWAENWWYDRGVESRLCLMHAWENQLSVQTSEPG